MKDGFFTLLERMVELYLPRRKTIFPRLLQERRTHVRILSTAATPPTHPRNKREGDTVSRE